MSGESWESIREQLIYDCTKLPHENIEQFFAATRIMRYEFVEEKINRRKKHVLISAWRNQVGLRDITTEFLDSFASHLIDISMGVDQKKYKEILGNCKKVLPKIKYYYQPSFTNILIIYKRKNPGEPDGIVKYNDLSEKLQEVISQCYELLGDFFSDLREFVSEEERSLLDNDYVRENSKYEWDTETPSKDFIVLAAALFASGAVKIRGHKKFMENTFTRDLAAFFGITNIFYDQNIRALNRKQKQPDDFLRLMQDKFNQLHEEKLLAKKKKKS